MSKDSYVSEVRSPLLSEFSFDQSAVDREQCWSRHLSVPHQSIQSALFWHGRQRERFENLVIGSPDEERTGQVEGSSISSKECLFASLRRWMTNVCRFFRVDPTECFSIAHARVDHRFAIHRRTKSMPCGHGSPSNTPVRSTVECPSSRS